MSVAFKDYYATLGVDKAASPEAIKKAFRALARTCHPDLAKEGNKAAAEAKFKEINEAYEVLKDPEKRAKYDRLGADWERYGTTNGAADDVFRNRARPGNGRSYEYHFGGTGFSDFFEQFFGGMGASSFGMGGFAGAETGRRPVRGQDVEAEIMVTLEEALHGASRRISLSKRDPRTGLEKVDTIDVKIPAGVRDGQRIRLAGQGHPSPTGGVAGDLFLKARLAQHPFFKVKDSDLYYDLKLAPWEAVLGTEVRLPTLGGSAKVKVKPGAKQGQRLRLHGHGLPDCRGGKGDLMAEIVIVVPDKAGPEEMAAWKRLRECSRFNPRK